MGLFDAFGVGGGELQIQLQYPQTQAGGVLTGAVVYVAGRRAQQITNISVKLTCNVQVMGPQGPQQQSTDICPRMQVAPAFATQPGQQYQFPFQLQLPPQAYASQPGQVSYRLSASADIDGEVDPGAGVDIQVMGQAYQPGMMGMDKAAFAKQQGVHGGYDPGADKAAFAKQQAMHDPYAKGGGYDPGADKAAFAKQQAMHDPYAQKSHDPYAQKGGYDPGYGAKGGGGAYGYAPGSHCLAQWSDGGYYGATVVQQQGNMYMVQWDDGSPATWVQDHQIQPG